MKNILQYQKIDGELLQLQKGIDASKEYEVLNSMASLYKDMQNNLFAIEQKANKIKDEYETALSAYDKAVRNAEQLSKKDIEKLEDGVLNDELQTANKLSSDLFMLERKLNMIITTMNETLKEFEQTKNKAFAARTKHAEAKTKIEEMQQVTQPKIEELQKQLKSLEKLASKELFDKYQSLKHDNIFPVFVPLKEKRCGYCRVELPNAKVDTLLLGDKQFIVCEQCGRLIYKEN